MRNKSCPCCHKDSHDHEHDHEHCHEHSHEHSHEDEHEYTLKGWLISLGVFLCLVVCSHLLNMEEFFASLTNPYTAKRICMFIWALGYLFVSYDILWGAIKALVKERAFDELFLMSVASIGAFAVGEYAEAMAVILFYKLGEYFCTLGEEKSKKNLNDLLALQPENANLITSDGKIKTVLSSELKKGDLCLVMAGERIGSDGIVREGSTFLDVSSLTGESKPLKVIEGDKVLSGSMNMSGVIKVEVTAPSSESTAMRIMALVNDASKSSSKREKYITRFARIYTPVVVGLAVLVFVLMGSISGEWGVWWLRALNFLVISCPCALVISVPLTYFMALGSASKHGVLIKGAVHIEDMEKVKTVCFDKTGTLTKETLNVISFVPPEKESELLHIALKGESHSRHPIALSIQRACTERGIEETGTYKDIVEIPGKGIVATQDDDKILLGNDKLLKDYGICINEKDVVNTIVNVVKNGKLIGKIIIGDEIKPEAKEVISALKQMNIKTVMLTGDKELSAKNIADQLNIESYKSQLLPLDKVNEVENLKKQRGKVAFVGDGINDAAVLLKADVGVSMGGISSDAAIESSSVVLVDPSLKGIVKALKRSSRAMKIVKENIAFSLGVKFLILILSVFGIGGMWLAVFGDVGLAALAILNALRV